MVSVAPLPKKKKKKETFRERYWRLLREKQIGLLRGFSASGVVWDEKGHILTSSAVLPSHDSYVQVTFVDGTVWRAKILFRRPELGIGLLRLPRPYGTPIPISLGKVKVGMWVASVGSPYDLIPRVFQLALSVGQITSLFPFQGEKYRGLLIETNATVDRGHFGGALVDARGRMIGLLSPFYSPNRYLGCAIPLEKLFPHLPKRPEGQGTPISTEIESWQSRWQKIWQRGKKWVFPTRVKGETKAKSYWSRPAGSVFPVLSLGQGYFLTSLTQVERALKDKKEIELLSPKVKLRFIAQHKGLDLALFYAPLSLPSPPFCPLSSHVEEGSELLAIGVFSSSQSLVYTFDWGILSSRFRFHKRFIPGIPRDFPVRLWQGSFRLNHGNLGGAVFDSKGHLIGIPVWPVRRTGQSSGVSLFVPLPLLLQLLPQMKQGKSFEKTPIPYVGLALSGSPPRVEKVSPASPAAKAGLRLGDLLLLAKTPFFRRRLQSPLHFRQVLEQLAPQDVLLLVVKREGKIIEKRLTVGVKKGLLRR